MQPSVLITPLGGDFQRHRSNECTGLALGEEFDALRREKESLMAKIGELKEENQRMKEQVLQLQEQIRCQGQTPGEHVPRTLAEIVADTSVEPSADWTRVPTAAERRNVRANNNNIKLRREQQRGPGRPDIVRVVPKAGTNCRDVIAAVRKDNQLADVVQSITWNDRHHALIKVKRGVDGQMVESTISKTVGDAAAATYTMTEMTTIAAKDIDILATPEDVVQAVKERIGRTIRPPRMVRFRNGMQATRFAVPRKYAAELTSTKLKIGYALSAARELGPLPVALRRCYRCLERGHLARDCKGESRGALCLNCGETGHESFGCEKPAKCIICKGEHRVGAKECTVKPAATQCSL